MPYVVDLYQVGVLPIGFQDRRIQPLCHFSALIITDLCNLLLHIWWVAACKEGMFIKCMVQSISATESTAPNRCSVKLADYNGEYRTLKNVRPQALFLGAARDTEHRSPHFDFDYPTALTRRDRGNKISRRSLPTARHYSLRPISELPTRRSRIAAGRSFWLCVKQSRDSDSRRFPPTVAQHDTAHATPARQPQTPPGEPTRSRTRLRSE